MRYFYRYNYFPDVEVPEVIEKLHAMVSDPNNFEASMAYMRNSRNMSMSEIKEVRFPKPPPEFDHCGWDIRTLQYGPTFQEVDEEFYHNFLVKQETEILADEMTIRAKLTTWHTPLETKLEDDEEIKEWLSNKFDLKLETIELKSY